MQLPQSNFPSPSLIPLLTLLLALIITITPTNAQDCNNNGIEDTTDITNGTSQDCNENGIPDECDVKRVRRLTTSRPDFQQYFGWSVSINGHVAVVGAIYTSQGQAHVFRWNGAYWVQETTFMPPGFFLGELFGYSVSVSGDVVVISDPLFDDDGAVFVYRWDGSAWLSEATLANPTSEGYEGFGHSVLTDGDVTLVGVPNDDDRGRDSGSVHVYRSNGTIWDHESTLLASDATGRELFGNSIDMDGEVIVVGAYEDGHEYSGAAYVFRWNGSAWVEEVKLTASDPAYEGHFGSSVAVDGDVAVIGADGDNPGGSVYVFRRNGTIWVEEAKLIPPDPADGDGFGTSVLIEDNLIAIGAPGDDALATDSGSTYLFRWDGSAWSYETSLTASTTGFYSLFGHGLSISDNRILVGAYFDSHYGSHAGAAYVIDLDASLDCNANIVPDECEVDCNSNGQVDQCDIAAGSSEDCNINTIPDECDTASGVSDDCNANNVPDECEADCDGNTVPDECDIAAGRSEDCNGNVVPDECELQDDCNSNGQQDICDIANGTAYDCNWSSTPDECDIADDASTDCNANDTPDECDVTREIKVTALDSDAGDALGCSVALCDDIMLIGASNHDVDHASNAGSAYVFRRDGSSWVEVAQLIAPDPAYGDHFGSAVSIDGDVAVVGAKDDDVSDFDSGSAYIYRWNGLTWLQEVKLVAPDAAYLQEFGVSVSVSSDVVVIGAHRDNSGETDSGAAYVYRWNGSSWSLEAKLTPPDPMDGGYFGCSVSVTGNVIVVGAWGEGNIGFYESGSAYVFRWNGTNWVQEAKLTASDAMNFVHFGYSVSISGNVAFIGASGDYVMDSSSGSAYVFRWDGTEWTQETKLTASDATDRAQFGYSVSVSGDIAVIGARQDDVVVNESGSAYVFRWNGENWIEYEKLISSNPVGSAHLGCAVSVSNGTTAVGAPYDGNNGEHTGAAYLFTWGTSHDCNGNAVPDECDPDVDNDSIPDTCDIDIDGDGLANGEDNCPWDDNGDQADEDVDGVGNVCDDCPQTLPDSPVDEFGCPPPVPGDFDTDGDVDQEEFGHLQVCYTGSGTELTDDACTDADIDNDNDVDADDFGIFQRCMSGANIPADPTCAD